MNTILMNNWFSVYEELKKAVKWVLLSTICVFAVSIATESKNWFLNFIMLIAMIPFNIPSVVQKKYRACQWERFSLTLPITRRDIVKGNFKFFVQITAIFFSFAVVFLGSAVVVSNGFGFEVSLTMFDVFFYLSVVLSISWVGQSLRYCMSLVGKDYTSELFQILVFLVSILPCGLPFYWFGFADYLENTGKYISVTLGLIGLFVVISYIISMLIITKKEF